MGSIASGLYVVFRDRTNSWEMKRGGHAGHKVIHPNLPTPNTDKDRSVLSTPTATEVGQDECRSQGVNRGSRRDHGDIPNLNPPQDRHQQH